VPAAFAGNQAIARLAQRARVRSLTRQVPQALLQRQPENEAFIAATRERAQLPADPAQAQDMLMASVRRNDQLAFVVNAILPYTAVNDIPAFVASVLAGLAHNTQERVAFVLCVNAPQQRARELAAALRRANSLIRRGALAGIPIALVPFTFKGKFPYGAARNAAMTSDQTRAITAAFIARRLHPYLSFQDFDTGSRLVAREDGPPTTHVFDHFARATAGADEGLEPTRPLLMAGGYRAPSESERDAAGGQRRGLPEILGADYPDFLAALERDMQARENLARINPLLPYAPEPNLFIDAILPIVDSNVRFGPGGAEYGALAAAINNHYVAELETYHTRLLRNTRLPRHTRPRRDDPAAAEHNEQVRSQLQAAAETGTHPIRGRAYLVHFLAARIVTDLSRLAERFRRRRRLLQTHDALTVVAGRIFSDRAQKRDVRMAEVRDDESRKRRFDHSDPLAPRQVDARRPPPEWSLESPQRLGSGRQLSAAVSSPFSQSGPFTGLSAGLTAHTRDVAIYEAARAQPVQLAARRIVAMLTIVPVNEPLPPDSFYEVIGRARSPPMPGEEVRRRAIEWLLSDENVERLAELTVAHRTDVIDLCLTLRRGRPGANVSLAPALHVVNLALSVVSAPERRPEPRVTRSLTAEALRDREELSAMLQDNSCLINAIAQARRMRPTLAQLLAIRLRLGSIGTMLVASPRTLQIIGQVLGINGVLVVYPYPIPAEEWGVQDYQTAVIRHTGYLHFEVFDRARAARERR
jgi:hypothetical protein